MPDQHPSRALDEPDAQPDGPITWRELAADFVRPSRSQLMIGLILLLCGLAVVMTVRGRTATEDYSSLRRADLVALLDSLNAESRKLEAEVQQLAKTKQDLQSGADRQQVARVEAQRRLEVLAILAGTAPAKGPGVRISIVDPNGKVTPEILLNAVQELRDAGAEVIEINDAVRLVANSWFGSGTGGLVVDGHTVTRPIVLEVIGDAHALTEASRFRGGLVSEVESDRVGGQVTITSLTEVLITTTVTPKPMQFARPA